VSRIAIEGGTPSGARRYPKAMLPTRSRWRRLCSSASRVRSPIASRSHCDTAVITLSTKRPAAEPVSSDSATEISVTPRRSNRSRSLQRSLNFLESCAEVTF
jgi:hypothetical protein